MAIYYKKYNDTYLLRTSQRSWLQAKENRIYLSTADGNIIPFKRLFLPYSPLLERYVKQGFGTQSNPISIQCDTVSIVTMMEDLERISEGIDIHLYEMDVLNDLSNCSRNLDIDILYHAYMNQVERKLSTLEANRVFNDLSREFNNLNTVVNLYLVIMQARKAYLSQGGFPEIVPKLYNISQKYGLYVLNYEGSLLISNSFVSIDQVNSAMGMAEVLGYCVDPTFGEHQSGKQVYYYDLYRDGIKLTTIITFVCNPGFFPGQGYLENMRERFQAALDQLNMGWQVRIRVRKIE